MDTKDLHSKLETIFSSVNPDKQGFLFIFSGDEDGDISAGGDMSLVSDTITQILIDGGTDKEHPLNPIAEAIMQGFVNAVKYGMKTIQATSIIDGMTQGRAQKANIN